MALKHEIEKLGLRNLDVATTEEIEAETRLVLLFGRSVRAQHEQKPSGERTGPKSIGEER